MLRFLIADKTLTSYENIPDQNLEFVDDNLAVLLKTLVCYVQVLYFKIHRIGVTFFYWDKYLEQFLMYSTAFKYFLG